MTTTDAGRASSRWLVGPPRWIFGAALLVTIAASLYAVSVPGGLFEPLLVAMVAWMALGVTFVVRLVIALANRAERRRFRQRAVLWSVFPVVMVVSYATASLGVPLRLGLEVAKADMLAYARDPGAAEPARVGPYRVRRAERLPDGGARFHLDDAGFLNSTGWAYVPAGPPASVPDEVMYTPVGNGWYEFVLPF